MSNFSYPRGDLYCTYCDGTGRTPVEGNGRLITRTGDFRPGSSLAFATGQECRDTINAEHFHSGWTVKVWCEGSGCVESTVVREANAF